MLVASSPTVQARSRAALMPIPQVQGSDASSPYEGASVSVNGVVTGIMRTGVNAGFFLQDPTGDGDAATSDGIFIRVADRIPGWLEGMAIGSRAKVTGVVSERGGLTAIEAATKGAIKLSQITRQSAIAPEVLDIPVDPSRRARYLEAREGMLATMPSALVVGPTNPYGQFVAVDADKHGARRMGSAPDVTGAINVNGKLGPKTQLTVGDRIEAVKGPIGVSGGSFELLPTGNYKSLTRGPQPPRMFGDIDGDDRLTDADRAAITTRLGTPAASPLDSADLNGDGTITRADLNRFDSRRERETGAPVVRIATLNAENFFDNVDEPPPIDDDVLSGNMYRLKVAKLAGAIRDRLGAPELLALEEVENTKVLDDLLARPELDGLGYQYVLLPTNGRRSIHPVLLYRSGAAEVLDARQAQKVVLTGEDSVWLTPDKRAATGPKDEPLFAREPLVVDLRLKDAQGEAAGELTLIVNHLISKFSPHGLPTEPLRIEQAKFLRTYVDELREQHPEREVVVLGDMNDTPDSKAMRAMTGPKRAPSLINATATIPPENERYSFIYDGKSELIDHVLVTPGLVDDIERAGVRHGNTDAPVGDRLGSGPTRASDHDSPYIWLRLEA